MFKLSGVKHSRFKFRHFNLAALTVILCLAFVAVLAFQPSAAAQTDQALAEEYAPILHFTKGEKFYPTSVNYIISSSVLKQRNNDGSSFVIDNAPTPNNLGTHTATNLFLSNKLETFEEIAADYAADAASKNYYAYVRVVRSGGATVIQYWLFYIFNNGPMNEHEGDIEVIQIFLDAAGNPQTALASQHGSGQSAAWRDVEKSDTHPIFYVAEGSHANYFRSYQGKMGIENDIVGSDGATITADQLTLVQLNSQSWLDFKGRWGYWGTETEVALGRAGPLGPKYNQDGTRWAQPNSYLASTFHVDGNYFILAWVVANFILFFVIYIAARSAWKIYDIVKLQRKGGGLRVLRFLKGRGGVGLIIGIVAIIITAIALFLPWYTVSASSQTGALAQEGGVTLMTLDGVNGVTINLFMGTESSDATSGYVNLFSAMMPFAIILGASVVLLILDVIGIKNGRSVAKTLLIGVANTLLPVILVVVFASLLSTITPFAAGLLPGQTVPSGVDSLARSISGSPLGGVGSSQFPVMGLTTVTWGLGLGSYLFIVAAVLRIIGGVIIYSTPNLQSQELQVESPLPPPPPPPVQHSAAASSNR